MKSFANNLLPILNMIISEDDTYGLQILNTHSYIFIIS